VGVEYVHPLVAYPDFTINSAVAPVVSIGELVVLAVLAGLATDVLAT
jgi:hypothetical protein